jgi:hypothetical protein
MAFGTYWFGVRWRTWSKVLWKGKPLGVRSEPIGPDHVPPPPSRSANQEAFGVCSFVIFFLPGLREHLARRLDL